MLIRGTRHGNELWGTDLADRIFGRQGDDILSGGAGDDFLSGDDGFDKLYGDGGNDELQGGAGNDILFGDGGGSDFLLGGRGNDLLIANDVDYQRDTIHGGPNDDWIYSSTGFDLMIGGAGNDTIVGMGGEYYGDGAPGVRSLAAGNDAFYTDLGSDYGTPRVMTGGGGRDHFDITANPEGVATAVTVTDFHNGEDNLLFLQHDPLGLLDMALSLDGNRDSRIDAADGGGVTFDPAARSLTLTVGDGDTLRFLGADHLDYLL